MLQETSAPGKASIGYKKSTLGIRVDSWDYNFGSEVLSLFVTDFRSENALETLSQTEVNRNFKRAEKFFEKSLNVNFLQDMEESAPGYELARKIHDNSSAISRIQFFLISNAELSSRVGSIENKDINGYKCTYNIWDISRLYRIESSGKAQEDITVDLTEKSPSGMPCLLASSGSDKCESYLLALPGKLVADLYDLYGERLLEQNVRTFLQFRGNVNKGLRITIQNEPEMFFAYNNGLTVTAEYIETNKENNKIKSIKNLQIVNGGQTAASIFTSMKKHNADLSSVHVQVKLTVIPPELVETTIPKISQYANTQNKVSAADFFSNHPFHLRIEEFSRRLWAPSPEGELRETHWFYERARGQYANAQAKLTTAEKKQFLGQNPRHQMFTKTDLAKFDFSERMFPHIVSLGAQKNFSKFASDIGEKWGENEIKFNELYFKKLIAKAILFRSLDKKIMKEIWYQNDKGYKANIVTYTIAKLVKMVQAKRRYLDLEKIWNNQKLSVILENQLLSIAEIIHEEIRNTPAGITNVSEYCKTIMCWDKIKELDIPFNEELYADLSEITDIREAETNAGTKQQIQKGIQIQTYVLEKGADYWKKISVFGLENKLLTEKEIGILTTACMIPQKLPSEKQSDVLVKIEEKVLSEGFSVV